ncbi:hypothetical protein STANM309S_03379 [Streptomyces tanashiensis]
MTNSVPSFWASSSAATLIGSVQSVGTWLPRLMETTSAPWADGPLHARDDPGGGAGAGVVEDLAVEEVRAGGDALLFPSLAAPEPPTVEMVWVPWPWWSPVVSESVKFSEATMRPLRSGCSASAPVSRTATLVPLPS